MSDCIDPDKIRVPPYELSDTSRETLIKLAKAGLGPAQRELERRGEAITKYHTPTKHKSDWDTSKALVRRV